MLLHLVCLISISPFPCTGQENTQIPSTNPELIEGPWETTGASGIDGIFLTIEPVPTGKQSTFACTTGTQARKLREISGRMKERLHNRTTRRMTTLSGFSTEAICAFIS